jgi:arginine decarboxylase
MTKTDARTRSKSDARSFRDHYAASQFRIETWNQLKSQTASLSSAMDEGRELEKLRASVGECLGLLLRIEHYWAFPGRRTCLELARLLERGWHRALARRTARVVRLLVGESYRKRNLTDLFTEETGEDEVVASSEDALEPDGTRESRPYFELLVVDDLDPGEEQELRPRRRPRTAARASPARRRRPARSRAGGSPSRSAGPSTRASGARTPRAG